MNIFFFKHEVANVKEQDQMSIDAVEGKTLRTQMTDNMMIHS